MTVTTQTVPSLPALHMKSSTIPWFLDWGSTVLPQEAPWLWISQGSSWHSLEKHLWTHICQAFLMISLSLPNQISSVRWQKTKDLIQYAQGNGRNLAILNCFIFNPRVLSLTQMQVETIFSESQRCCDSREILNAKTLQWRSYII